MAGRNNQLCVEFLNECQNFYTFIKENKKDINYFVIQGNINNYATTLIWKDGILFKNKKRTSYKLSDIFEYSIDKIYMKENTLWEKFLNEIDRIAYIEKNPYKWDFKTKTLEFESGSVYKYSYLTEEIVEE